MSPKDLFRKLCQTEESIPIFSRSWWLDAVCGPNQWDVLLVQEKEKIQAVLPYYKPHPKAITMPPYTQTMGIWFAPLTSDTKYLTALEHKQSLATRLIENLPPFHSFLQNFSYSFTDWLPFYWKGFEQTTRYTYLLKGIQDHEILWDQMSKNMRRNIKKAENEFGIMVKPGVSVDEFIAIQEQTFSRQGLKNKQSRQALRNLITTTRERNQGEIFGGYDPEGCLHAAAFIVWQKQSAYYLAGGVNTELRHSCAQSLVLWKAIQHTASYADIFDFEGSMLQGVERFFREFGSIQTPYFTIKKGNLSLLHRAWIKLTSV